MEMETKKQSAFFYGWVIVVVAIITSMLVYGVRYSFSIFFPEILSEFGWSRGSTALMMSINVFVYGLMAPIAGALSSTRNPKMLMPIGVAILALALIGCSIARELWHFYLFYGVMVPVGTALCGWPIISPALMNWFYTRRGLIMGFGQAGSGLSFAYGLLTQYLILHLGWRLAYVALAAILVTILLPLHRFVFHHHPASMGLKAYGSGDVKPGTGVGTRVPPRDWTVPEMLRTYHLWLLIFYFFLFWGIACFLVLAHQIKYAEDAGYTSVFAVSVFALFGVSMFLGQVSGVISDRIGREKAMAASSAAALLGLLALIAVRDTSQPWLLYVYAIMFGFGAGLSTAILFAGAADIFRGKHFGTASGMLLTGMGTGGAIGPWLGGYLYDITGSYDFAFSLCMASIVLASACYWFAAPRNAGRLRARRLDSHVGGFP
ncbi:MAG: MFS transporter [Deltaproteobacteria bacterium]|nr:MFS transporter [Deltaproteobacteria bacterium]